MLADGGDPVETGRPTLDSPISPSFTIETDSAHTSPAQSPTVNRGFLLLFSC